MNDQDKHAFKELMNATSEYYQRDPLSKMALQIYFTALSRFSIEQIQEAISLHIQRKGGEFYPKASDVIKILEGGDLTHDQIISEARLKRTPLGILCRIKIGSWDLENQTDMFYLKQRAEECLALLPEWKSRALGGEYTDHEISIMLKHGVSPAAPFHGGLPAPAGAQQIRNRAHLIEKTPRHKRLMEPAYGGDNDKKSGFAPEVAKFIAKEQGRSA